MGFVFSRSMGWSRSYHNVGAAYAAEKSLSCERSYSAELEKATRTAVLSNSKRILKPTPFVINDTRTDRVGERVVFEGRNSPRRFHSFSRNTVFPGRALTPSIFNNLRPACFLGFAVYDVEGIRSQVYASGRMLFPGKALSFSRNASLFCRTKTSDAAQMDIPGEITISVEQNPGRISRKGRDAAQDAVLDYLHCTRGLHFTDADHMSKNSPDFIRKLLSVVGVEQEIKHALIRFFRYHPINEFEPFFESIGLRPSEFAPFLPKDLLFLCDDRLLLENYHVLCNYGVPRIKLGRVYLEAREVFRYDYGILQSKIRSYEMLGLNSSTLIKLIVSCPLLLVGDVNTSFAKVLEEFKDMGIEYDWLGGCVSEKSSYDWNNILRLLKHLKEFGCSKKHLGELLRKHCEFLFDASGSKTYTLITLFLKSGLRMNEIMSILFQFPEVAVGNFVKNFWQGIHFLNEIEMKREDIAKIVRSHPQLLGSCCFKKSNVLLSELNVGKKRLCTIILEDPNQLSQWVKGRKVRPLPGTGEEDKARYQKTEFLLRLGFPENSDEMAVAFRRFRGRGDELQERFDCLVKAGMDCQDVVKMIKVSPPVLNQSSDVITRKIDILVNSLNYPLQTIVSFPSLLCYDPDRIKLRVSMYNWLTERGFVRPMLTLSTILACSEERFVKHFVSVHPEGLQVWERLKGNTSSI
ncbi:hypothetical protein EJ110_NYTH39259 [Nymphaea thermarum]|nr:hypothetical protein EJ110_NYTH39259 [Nymphaea thermarum]